MSSHLSEEQIAASVAGERTAEIEKHARECAACAAELARMEEMFSAFRESGKRWSEHWYAAAPVRRPQGRTRLALAAAAGLVVAAVLLVRSPAPAGLKEQAFIAIPYVVPPAPYERTSVVRMNIPVAALSSAGIPVELADASSTVAADVLVGQDGRALAIRVLNDSDFSFGRRYNR